MSGELELGTAAERVARGVALLDSAVPRWWERVDAVELRMADPCGCVLGWVYGQGDMIDGYTTGFALGQQELGLGYEHDGYSPIHGTVRYGFDRLGGDVTYSELRDEWRKVIAAREQEEATQ